MDEVSFYDYRLDDPHGDDDTADSRVLIQFRGTGGDGVAPLQAGDANMDHEFNQWDWGVVRACSPLYSPTCAAEETQRSLRQRDQRSVRGNDEGDPVMICWSCHKEIPDTAEFCPHCEAEAMEEPPADVIADVQSILASMSPDLMDELRDAFEKSTNGEDFVNRIMVGDCPKCGSSNTGDCENDPELSDPCVGRCLDCGQLWCCDCGRLFQDQRATDHDCPAWEDSELDDDCDGDDSGRR